MITEKGYCINFVQEEDRSYKYRYYSDFEDLVENLKEFVFKDWYQNGIPENDGDITIHKATHIGKHAEGIKYSDCPEGTEVDAVDLFIPEEEVAEISIIDTEEGTYKLEVTADEDEVKENITSILAGALDLDYEREAK
jgi:hypothetical protein